MGPRPRNGDPATKEHGRVPQRMGLIGDRTPQCTKPSPVQREEARDRNVTGEAAPVLSKVVWRCFTWNSSAVGVLRGIGSDPGRRCSGGW